jgi:hypothetical protein
VPEKARAAVVALRQRGASAAVSPGSRTRLPFAVPVAETSALRPEGVNPVGLAMEMLTSPESVAPAVSAMS